MADGGEVTFTFDGRTLRAPRGATVAAALMANGIRSWRVTRTGGRPRGLFCGIGHCFDCLVDVRGDGAGEVGVRACRTSLRDGDRVRTCASYGERPEPPDAG
ncbi:MAG: (2Fe-2S)-binding protein [Streptosporangiaceae bacterium]